jgi:DNA-binding PadR family transcriptional regulator
MALSHAILTALNDAACSGYDLAKRFDGSVGFFWNASHQQIYRELTKLEESGYIEPTVIHQDNRPDKKNYLVTPAGQDYLRSWIAEPSTVAYPKDELLVKLFAGDLVDRDVILAALEQHRVQHQDRLNTYYSIEQQIFAHPVRVASPRENKLNRPQRYQYLTLRQGIRLETAWLAWCAEAIESIGLDD